MINLKTVALALLTICHIGHAYATLEHDDGDFQRSRANFLISGENFADLSGQQKRGVMTLCFKQDNQEAAMVFEFFPRGSTNLSLLMAYAGLEDTCCGARPAAVPVVIQGPQDTLKKVYRAFDISIAAAERKYSAPTYTRYASWILPNDRLTTAVRAIEQDRDQKLTFTNFDYIKRIMTQAGLENISPDAPDLKVLASAYVNPRPGRLEGHFSPLPR